MSGTLSHLSGVEDGVYALSQLACGRVEVHLAYIILYLFVAAGDGMGHRRTEVEGASVGREYRVCLVVRARHDERVEQQFVGGWLIDEDVGSLVEYLYTLAAHGMEALMGLIGAVGAVLARWMPVGIDHRTVQRIALGLEPFALAIDGDEGCTMTSTDVESKL